MVVAIDHKRDGTERIEHGANVVTTHRRAAQAGQHRGGVCTGREFNSLDEGESMSALIGILLSEMEHAFGVECGNGSSGIQINGHNGEFTGTGTSVTSAW